MQLTRTLNSLVVAPEKKPATLTLDDILVDFPPEKGVYRKFIYLADELEELFGRSVDLVTVKGLSPYIRPYVEREVIWVYG